MYKHDLLSFKKPFFFCKKKDNNLLTGQISDVVFFTTFHTGCGSFLAWKFEQHLKIKHFLLLLLCVSLIRRAKEKLLEASIYKSSLSDDGTRNIFSRFQRAKINTRRRRADCIRNKLSTRHTRVSNFCACVSIMKTQQKKN